MLGMDLSDIVLIGLLLAAIGYCYLLSRRIETMRRALIDFGPALESFVYAVDRSEKSVGEFQALGQEFSKKLKSENVPSENKEGDAARSADTNLMKKFYSMTKGGHA